MSEQVNFFNHFEFNVSRDKGQDLKDHDLKDQDLKDHRKIIPDPRNIFYPDNDKRQTRAEGLIIMIGTIQDSMRRSSNDWEAEEKRLIPILDKLAKDGGHKTIDEYVNHSLRILSKEDRERFEEIRDEMNQADKSLAISSQVAGVVAGIGTAAGVTALVIKLFVMDKMIAVMMIRALALGVAKIVTGSIQAGSRLIGVAVKGLKGVFKAAGTAGTVGATALKFFKVVGKFLTVAAFLLELANLIAEAITGAQARDDLRNAILEFASRRFSAAAAQLKVDVIKTFKSSASTIIQLTEDYTELVNEGDMTQERMEEKLREKFGKLQDQFNSEMLQVDDAKVLKEVAYLDSSTQAWTNEDPDLHKMLAWIKEHEDDDAAAFAGKTHIPDAEIVPWNWNPEGIDSLKVRAIGPKALNYHDYLSHTKY